MKKEFAFKVLMPATFAQRQELWEGLLGLERKLMPTHFKHGKVSKAISRHIDCVFAEEDTVNGARLVEMEKDSVDLIKLDRFNAPLFLALAAAQKGRLALGSIVLHKSSEWAAKVASLTKEQACLQGCEPFTHARTCSLEELAADFRVAGFPELLELFQGETDVEFFTGNAVHAFIGRSSEPFTCAEDMEPDEMEAAELTDENGLTEEERLNSPEPFPSIDPKAEFLADYAAGVKAFIETVKPVGPCEEGQKMLDAEEDREEIENLLDAALANPVPSKSFAGHLANIMGQEEQPEDLGEPLKPKVSTLHDWAADTWQAQLQPSFFENMVSMPLTADEGEQPEQKAGVLYLDKPNPTLFKALSGQKTKVSIGMYLTPVRNETQLCQVTDLTDGLIEVTPVQGKARVVIVKQEEVNGKHWRISTVRDLVRTFGEDTTVQVSFPNGRELTYEGPQVAFGSDPIRAAWQAKAQKALEEAHAAGLEAAAALTRLCTVTLTNGQLLQFNIPSGVGVQSFELK